MVKSVRATDFTLGNVIAVATTRAGPALGTYCRSALRSEIEHIALLCCALQWSATCLQCDPLAERLTVGDQYRSRSGIARGSQMRLIAYKNAKTARILKVAKSALKAKEYHSVPSMQSMHCSDAGELPDLVNSSSRQ